MRLYINGQDINHLVLADIDDKTSLKKFNVEPEEYLRALDEFLSAHDSSAQKIKEIFVVIGPGSATALRSSLSIVNTMAFVLGIKLHGIEKLVDEQDLDTVRLIGQNKLGTIDNQTLMPKYAQEAKITLSTKDVLKRKQK